MADPIPRFETGDTREFTIQYSVAPGTTPLFAVFQGSGGATCIQSTTATSSSSTQWFAFHTVVACTTTFVAQWIASYTSGPVVNRLLFQAIKTVP